MDTINVVVRTVVFTSLVLWWPKGAVVAFSAAQISAGIVYVACYFFYFTQYLDERRSKSSPAKEQRQQSHSSEDDFPFTHMSEFLPRHLENQVRLKCVTIVYSLKQPLKLYVDNTLKSVKCFFHCKT